MPQTPVILYCEEDGSSPFLEWLDDLPIRAKAKCLLRVERLRDGIYELRVSLHGVQYRILYFFHGTVAAVVAHGIVKESAVPPREIDRAIERKKRFEANPAKHRQTGGSKK